MIIREVSILSDRKLGILSDDGRRGIFDVEPYLSCEAFDKLKDKREFQKIINGKYYIEWECGADLSADTVEAKMVASNCFPLKYQEY